MRSAVKLALAACLLLGVSALAGATEKSPFAGTWKVTLPQGPVEVSLWIVKVDPKGKNLEMVAGVGPYGKATTDKVRITDKAMAFRMSTEKQVFTFAVNAPQKDGRIRGAARIGSNILPAWLDPTELDALDEKTAVRQMEGFRELQAAIKMADPEDRNKEFEKLIQDHAGKPAGFFALQSQITDRVLRQKSDPATLKPLVERYLKMCIPHGREMQLGANLDLTRTLLNHPKGGPLAAETARAAARLLSADHPPELRVTAHYNLASALQSAGETKALPAVAADLDRAAAEGIKNVKGGDEAALAATGNVASTLLRSPAGPVADLGLEYARRAMKLLNDKSTTQHRAAATRLLHRALVSRGKAEEAKKLAPAVEKLERELDAEFRKTNVPFELDKYPGRKNKDGRVVLVELFTNVQAPPCVAADVAFTAASQVYPSSDVAFVQYHVNRERALDALATAANDTRINFYQADVQDLVPALLVDGKVAPPSGGGRQRAKLAYDSLREMTDKALKTDREARIKLDVKRTGDRIEVKANVSGLKTPSDSLRLRIALVEKEVRHQGNSGQRLHPHVVRTFLGGTEGFKLARAESSHAATVDLAAWKKAHAAYLDEVGKKANFEWFDRPMELKRLAVVAWVQDEDSKKVYEAAQEDVP